MLLPQTEGPHKEIGARKAALRRRLRGARMAMPRDERESADRAILDRLVFLPSYADASLVLTYLSFGAEVDTHPLIERAWADGKTVAIPRCVTGARAMRWYAFDAYEGLVRSRFGLLEPDPATFEELGLSETGPTLAIVPGLAFDRAGFRLGYGGGYYDTFLATFTGVSVGLCRGAQIFDSLCKLGVIDSYDVPVDIVVDG